MPIAVGNRFGPLAPIVCTPLHRLSGASCNLKLRLLTSPVADPESIPADAPAAVVPEDHADFYLLITSDRQNPVAPVRMGIINANDTHLARGQMLWFNLTDKAVAGTVGREKITIKPGARELIKEPRSGKGDYPVDLYFLIKGDNFIHPLCETQWRHDPRSRSLVFIMTENNRRAKYYSLTRSGRRQLEKEQEIWERMSAIITTVLQTAWQVAVCAWPGNLGRRDRCGYWYDRPEDGKP